MKLISNLLLVCTMMLFFGCATGTKMYDFGNYSQTLYSYKRAPSEKTMLVHTQELENIIKNSNKDSLRVPPGIYCEYASLLLKQNKKEEALKNLALEEQTYPESKIFITRLRNFINPPVVPADNTSSKTVLPLADSATALPVSISVVSAPDKVGTSDTLSTDKNIIHTLVTTSDSVSKKNEVK
jgi:hypothetical protein